MVDSEVSRKKQVMIAFAILATITVGALSLLLGWRLVPGLLGEWLGVLAGVISTPFFLEATFFVMGLLIVTGLNSWRRSQEGDECVFLDQVTGSDLPKNLPDQARWVIYRETPLPGEDVSMLDQAEGAVAIGDFETASAVIAGLSHEELAADGVLEVRIALADGSGKRELAEKLRRELAARR